MGVSELAFHPLGVPGLKSKPFNVRTNRLLVVSPFLTAGQLTQIADRERNDVLVSRLDSLQKLNARQLSGFSEIFALDPAAAIDPERATETLDDPFNEGAGLHAKLYIADDGWDAHIWTGSANATAAAFDGNVELLVELIGKKSELGVEAFLRTRDGVTTFRDLLKPYTPAEDAIEEDATTVALDRMLEQGRMTLATLPWVATVTGVAEGDGYDLCLQAKGAEVAAIDLSAVKVHSITLQQARAQTLDRARDSVAFTGLTPEALTSFFAFELVVEKNGQTKGCRFVVNAALVGAPANRREGLLRSMLKDRRQVIRFLLMLLGDIEGGPAETDGSDSPSVWRGTSAFSAEQDQALLEPLLRALDRDPSRLDQVERILRDLGIGNGNGALLEGFDELFAPIWQARAKVRT